MAKTFSILIPTWNNLPYLKLCVDSIRKHSCAEHQIIVHVNEGTDGTLEWVKAEGLDYTYSRSNIGVCLAMNMMRRLVKTDYILFLNDDMYVLPQWDQVMMDEVESLPDNLFYLSGTMIQPHAAKDVGICANYGDSVETFQEEKLLYDYKNFSYDDWQGATRPPTLVHRDIWDLVGGYSIELSPGMYSDPDFTAKLLLIGVKYFKGLGKSFIYHFETRTTGRIKKNGGAVQFLLKWGLSNSDMRKLLTRQGEKWETHHTPINHKVLSRKLRLARFKAIWYLLIRGFGNAHILGDSLNINN